MWTPKGTSPASFRLRDAFLALITGDATWGWLVDWLPEVGGDSWNTAEFCARGPIDVPALDPTDFIGPKNRNPFVAAAELAARAWAIGRVAEDRVFGAFCENIVPLVGGWGPTHCWDSLSQGSWSAGGWRHTGIFAPPGATAFQFVSLTLYGSNAFGNLFYLETTGDGGTTRTYLETGNLSQAMSWTTSKQWAITAGHEVICDSNAGWTGIFCFRFNAGETQDHEPTDQPAPTDYVPLPHTSPDLPGIAAEVDELEKKLDIVIYALQTAARFSPNGPSGAVDEPVDAVEDELMPVGDAIGIVIDVAGNTAPLDLAFGVPQRLAKLGRVNFNTELGWYPSLDLTHFPFVVRPLPPETTDVTVSQLPPGITATISYIRPTK